MNIFRLHNDPMLCAIYSMDIHIGKMINECCLMLSIAHYKLDKHIPYKDQIPFKDNPKYHDWVATKWVRSTNTTYEWTFKYYASLCEEYEYRFGKRHKSAKFLPFLQKPPLNIPTYRRMKSLPEMEPALDKNFPKKYWVPNLNEDGTQVTFIMFLTKEVRLSWNTVETYRNYYLYSKSRLKSAGWTRRSPPYWYTRVHGDLL